MVRMRNREEEAQQQKEASRIETHSGSEQFRQAIDTAREDMKPLLEFFTSLRRCPWSKKGWRNFSQDLGSTNTVLRVQLPDSDGGFFNVIQE